MNRNRNRCDSAKCEFMRLKNPAVSLSLLIGNDREVRAGWTRLTIAMTLPQIGQANWAISIRYMKVLIAEYKLCYGDFIWTCARSCNYSCSRRQLKTRPGKGRAVRMIQGMETTLQVKSKRSYVYAVMNHKFRYLQLWKYGVFLKRLSCKEVA